MTAKKPVAKKPETTPAAPKRDDSTDKDVAPLVEVKNPDDLTDKEINEETGDGLKPKQDDTPNEDAAETMQRNRDAAKHPEKEPERGYFHGQGGAIGI